jgi:phosphinothricin acetyltransferase
MTKTLGRRDGVAVRGAEPADAADVAAIYNPYVAETIITFEEERVSSVDMALRIESVCSDGLPWLVAERGGRIVGYAYASKWRGRIAYRFSAEATVYVAREEIRTGVGSRLYGKLLPVLRSRGFHLVIGGISLPNDGSVALHERFGFEKVAHFKEVGFKLDRWIDVGYWQLLL